AKFFRQANVLLWDCKMLSIIKFSKDGTKLVSCSDDRKIQVWDTSRGKIARVFDGVQYILDAKFLPDKSLVVICPDHSTFRLLNVNLRKKSKRFHGHTDRITIAQFSPDGQTIASYSEDRTIQLWNVKSASRIKVLSGHVDTVNCVEFSSDGLTLLSCSADRTIRTWDVDSGKNTRIFKGHAGAIMKARFSGDGKFIVSCSEDSTIRIWDVELGTEIRRMKEEGVGDIGYSPDGLTVVSASSTIIHIWDVEKGMLLQVLEGHSAGITTIHCSSNGKAIASCSDDRTIRLWKW
ncbi:WD-repeat protein, partial [Reticulomyxa filosa]